MVDECSIPANFWRIENDEEGGARRLFLICDIGVPSDAGVAVAQETFEFRLRPVAVDEMDFWVALWRPASLESSLLENVPMGKDVMDGTYGMDVMSTEVSTKVERLLDRQIC